MISLRMLGLASALLLLLPIGVMAMPDDGSGHAEDDDSVLDAYQGVTATVYDVVLAQMPREREYDAASFHEAEQLVEGHTVFAVIELESRETETNGSVDIMGMVDCKAEAGYTGPTFLGIPLPERIDRAHVECRIDEKVVVSPDPFQDPPLAQPTPTGRLIPFRTPTGERAYAEELSYPVQRTQPDGTLGVATHYAWSVPIWQPWLDAHGRPKNFYAPLPEDKLREMGIGHFKVYHEDDWARAR